MGNHTYVDIVKAKIEPSMAQQVDIRQAKLAVYESSDEANRTGEYSFDVRGWCWDSSYPSKVKDYPDKVSGTPMTKGKLVVWEINESQYSMVEGMDEESLSYYAKDKKALVQFCLDMGWDPKDIESPATAQWTG